MAERKVVNKYYPPEFDPSNIPRRLMPKNQQQSIRNMLSMRLRCRTCGNYMSEGTKFNTRKETVVGEAYKGIPVYRFYIKCSNCSAEITWKTAPKNHDYVVEFGAVRLFDASCVEVEDEDYVGEEIGGDQMKILSTLDELQSMKSRQARVSVDAMLEALKRSSPVQQEEKHKEEDEALVKSVFRRPKEFVRRIDDGEIDDDSLTKRRKIAQEVYHKPTDRVSKTRSNKRDKSSVGIVHKSLLTVKFSVIRKSNEEKNKSTCSGLQSLCQHYESDEED